LSAGERSATFQYSFHGPIEPERLAPGCARTGETTAASVARRHHARRAGALSGARPSLALRDRQAAAVGQQTHEQGVVEFLEQALQPATVRDQAPSCAADKRARQ
jgi:hypothetical protein